MKKIIIAVITTLICVGAFAQTPPINPESISVNSEYTFSTTDGNAGEVQISNGSGQMSFDSLSFANLKGKDTVLTISDTVSTLATQYDLTQVGVTIPENLIPYGDPSSELTTESAFNYNPSNNTLSADNFNGSEISLIDDMTVANIFSPDPANAKTLTTGTALNTGINLLMTGTGSANPGDIRFRNATTNLLDYDSSEDEWVFNGKKASDFSGIQIDSDNISTFIRSYDNTSYSEITALIGGTPSGGVIESAGRKHLVVGIRSNDDTDGFHVISTSTDYDAEVNGTAAPYDTRVASFYADGNVEIPGTLTINDYTLPSSDGNPGEVMTTDAAGDVSFESMKVGVATDLTISSGEIFPPAQNRPIAHYRIDTEGGAATDILDVINTSNAEVGDIIILSTVSNLRDVTLDESVGNINMPGTSVDLNFASDQIMLEYRTDWNVLSFSDNR